MTSGTEADDATQDHVGIRVDSTDVAQFGTDVIRCCLEADGVIAGKGAFTQKHDIGAW